MSTQECVICYKGSELVKTPCNHTICSECLFKMPSVSCPMCRTSMFSNMTNIGFGASFNNGASFEIIIDPVDAERLRLSVPDHENVLFSPPSPSIVRLSRIRSRNRTTRYMKLKNESKRQKSETLCLKKRIKKLEKFLTKSEQKEKVTCDKLHKYRMKRGKTQNMREGYCSYRSVFYGPDGERTTREQALLEYTLQAPVDS